MKVVIYGEEYNCTKAIKGNNFVKLYNNGNKIAEFNGISDFSGYTIEDGEWSKEEPSQLDRIEAQLTYTAMMSDTLLEEV